MRPEPSPQPYLRKVRVPDNRAGRRVIGPARAWRRGFREIEPLVGAHSDASCSNRLPGRASAPIAPRLLAQSVNRQRKECQRPPGRISKQPKPLPSVDPARLRPPRQGQDNRICGRRAGLPLPLAGRGKGWGWAKTAGSFTPSGAPSAPTSPLSRGEKRYVPYAIALPTREAIKDARAMSMLWR